MKLVTLEKKLDYLERILKENKNIVCLVGFGMVKENGYPNYKEDSEAYDTELQYGYSPEELFSTEFYATRKDQFFDYYRDHILNVDAEPNASFYALAKLENAGKLNCTITRTVYNLPQRAGCQNVINLHGSVFENICLRCGRRYPVEYIKFSRKVPMCKSCNTALRPGVTLFGEMIDNQLTTREAEEISKADILMVLGSTLKSFLSETALQYFEGSKVILINSCEHYADRMADLVIHERINKVLPYVVRRMGY